MMCVAFGQQSTCFDCGWMRCVYVPLRPSRILVAPVDVCRCSPTRSRRRIPRIRWPSRLAFALCVPACPSLFCHMLPSVDVSRCSPTRSRRRSRPRRWPLRLASALCVHNMFSSLDMFMICHAYLLPSPLSPLAFVLCRHHNHSLWRSGFSAVLVGLRAAWPQKSSPARTCT